MAPTSAVSIGSEIHFGGSSNPALMNVSDLLRPLFANQGFRRYLANTSWLLAEKILRIIAGVFVGVYVARYLGPMNFGIYSYALAFAMIFSAIAKLGLDDVMVRQLINCPSQRDQYLGTAFWLKIMGAIASLVIIAAVLSLTSNDAEVSFYIIIIASGFLFQSLEVISFDFQANVQAKYISISQMVQLAVASMLKLVFIFAGAQLVWFVALSALDQFMVAAVLVYAGHKKQLPVFYLKFSLAKARQLLSDSWPLILSGLAVMVYMRVDQIMIKEILGEKEVGIYSAAVRLSEALYFVPVVITASLFPAILNARKTSEVLYYQRLQHLFTLIVWLAVAVAIVISFGAERIISVLYGFSYQGAGVILAIHVWAAIFVGMGVVGNKWLLAENYVKLVLSRVFTGALINIFLNMLMIPEFGSSGAAVATLVSQFIAAYAIDLASPRTRRIFLMKTRAILLKGVG
jgi:O-antigen/teichoic acid export membrane protein